MTRILDPTIRAARPAALEARAPRPAALAGGTLGLLANGKSNGMAILDRVAAALMTRHALAEVVRVSKTNASVPVTEEQAEELVKRCAAVVTAIGD